MLETKNDETSMEVDVTLLTKALIRAKESTEVEDESEVTRKNAIQQIITKCKNSQSKQELEYCLQDKAKQLHILSSLGLGMFCCTVL
jgi:hypothetical protein